MDSQGRKTGGRAAGTANKATREVKAFLARVFGRAFVETIVVMRPDPVTGDPVPVVVSLEDVLVAQILTMQIDPSLLRLFLGYYAGAPAKAVDVNHRGTVNLAQLIAGTAPVDDGDEDADSE